MISLFSRFDLWYFPFCFVVFIAGFFIAANQFYKINFFRKVLLTIKSNLITFFLSLKSKRLGKILVRFRIAAIYMIAFINFFSVLPFRFSVSSQMRGVLYLSSGIWLTVNTFYLLENSKGFLRHCIPDGTPIYLTWLLFLIELVRNLIRPLTLTVRLVANILAGHLLIILLSNLALTLAPVAVAYAGLNTVEFFVALIQSYIFVTIINLYHADLS